MADTGHSVLDRLKNKARATGHSHQFILQLFCQEEFLRKLQRSRYNQNFILKGGLLIYAISGFRGRPTRDIDFLLKNVPNKFEIVSRVIEEIINTSPHDSVVTFEIIGLDPIAEHRNYGGVRVKLIGRIKNTRTRFNIDLGIGDIVVPRPETISVPTQLPDFESPVILAYSLESIVAEKFEIIISRLALNSRMKDFYDIFFLASTYPFDGRRLQDALFETLQRRGTIYDSNTSVAIRTLVEDHDMKDKWRRFCRDTLETNIDFHHVIFTVLKFMGPVFDSILHETEFFDQWSPELLTYRKASKR